MMRLLLLVLLVALGTVTVQGADERRYTTRYDNIDLERILSSRRLVTNYVECLLGRKRCPPEAVELKRVLPDALATQCAKCSPQQREMAIKVIRRLQSEYPDLWRILLQQFDPSGEKVKRFEQAVKRRIDAKRAK
ncbi:ejaculatory bulb-specific protein 3 [Anabrus simplex]|uniref:ejaculatory bulb-specific protein 3 n=1 Tax=Anabrus simplex TaxID=316456 RepID=UPI0034DD1364